MDLNKSGILLAKHRKSKGVTQKEVADIFGFICIMIYFPLANQQTAFVTMIYKAVYITQRIPEKHPYLMRKTAAAKLSPQYSQIFSSRPFFGITALLQKILVAAPA